MGFYFDAVKEMQRGVPTGVLESEIRVFPTRNSYCSTVGPSCGCDSDCSRRPNPPACEAVLRFPILSLLYISPM